MTEQEITANSGGKEFDADKFKLGAAGGAVSNVRYEMTEQEYIDPFDIDELIILLGSVAAEHLQSQGAGAVTFHTATLSAMATAVNKLRDDRIKELEAMLSPISRIEARYNGFAVWYTPYQNEDGGYLKAAISVVCNDESLLQQLNDAAIRLLPKLETIDLPETKG